MNHRLRIGLFVTGALFAIIAAACSDGDHHHGAYVVTPGSSVPPQGGTTPSPDGGSGASPTPLLVDVDPNQTLSAAPGDGAGVFIEYATGGHWHVWWTCDTNKTQLSCAYDVSMSVASGQIASPTPDADSTTIATSTGASIQATSTTTANVDGVRFDTAPGATITVDAAIGGLRDGSFLFFVQNGQINGGYTGKLTDPLKLEPSSP